MIVTATGLQVLAFGGIELVVDGEPVDLPRTMAYKALMLSGVPNFVYTIGYTNASWTLKADLVSTYVVRLLEHLDRIGARSVVPVRAARTSRSCRSWTSRPATCCAPSTSCPSRATGRRGGSSRTTSPTCAPSSAGRSTTACSPSTRRARPKG